MADGFCARCGVQVGFFSRKKRRRPDGSVVELCKPCAKREEDEAAAQASRSAGEASPTPAPASAPGAVPGTPEVERGVRALVAGFRAQTGIDLSGDALAMTRLRDVVGTLVPQILAKGEAEVNMPFITADSSGPKHLLAKLRRSDVDA